MKIKIVYIVTTCERCGPIQQTMNILRHMDRNAFEPYLITIYEERSDSRLKEFESLVVRHEFIKTSKQDILVGNTERLRKALGQIQPDIVHTLGVFPNYAISRMKSFFQMITIRNYVYEEYPPRFGKVKGYLLAFLELYAIKHANKCIACSKSLALMYKKRQKIDLGYIQNGLEMEQYPCALPEEKFQIRREIGFSESDFLFIYTGVIITRKNLDFMIKVFTETFPTKGVHLLILGEGSELKKLIGKYGNIENVHFMGHVNNVSYFLKACDAFLFTSKSEGLPNSVLEAMASGLPVILSDIEQHKEIYELNPDIGFLYHQNDEADLSDKLRKMVVFCNGSTGEIAYQTVYHNFNAIKMSENYQDMYRALIKT